MAAGRGDAARRKPPLPDAIMQVVAPVERKDEG
jgi:hypothetical protein